MKRFLTDNDYKRRIQTDDLNQIIEGEWSYIYESEQIAQSEISSYIAKRYDVSRIFLPTTSFNINTAYNANALVYVTADYFDSGNTYNIGDRVIYSGSGQNYIYNCIQSGFTGNTPTDTNYWTKGVLDMSLYFVTLPAPFYMVDEDYIPGMTALKDNYVYTNIKATNNRWLIEDYQGQVEGDSGSAIIPGYSNNWQEYWTVASSTYTVSNVYPDLDTEGNWTAGDNRNFLLTQYMMDIVLYHLYARINPRNIPELANIRYDGNNASQNGGAIAWLKRISEGQLQLDALEIVPTQGQSLFWVSSDKRTLNY